MFKHAYINIYITCRSSAALPESLTRSWRPGEQSSSAEIMQAGFFSTKPLHIALSVRLLSRRVPIAHWNTTYFPKVNVDRAWGEVRTKNYIFYVTSLPLLFFFFRSLKDISHLTAFLLSTITYRVLIKYCVFCDIVKFFDISEVCQFCRSTGFLPAWCVYTHRRRGKTEKGQSP